VPLNPLYHGLRFAVNPNQLISASISRSATPRKAEGEGSYDRSGRGVAGSSKLPYRFCHGGLVVIDPGTYIYQPCISNAIHVMRYIHVIQQRQACLETSAESTSMIMDQTEPTIPSPGYDKKEPMTTHDPRFIPISFYFV
jgi:hypothetical protein